MWTSAPISSLPVWRQRTATPDIQESELTWDASDYRNQCAGDGGSGIGEQESYRAGQLRRLNLAGEVRVGHVDTIGWRVDDA